MAAFHRTNWFRFFFVYCFALSVSLLTGCGGVNPPSGADGQPTSTSDLEWGAIGGTVTASGGVPLAGAFVETSSKQAITATQGTYLLGPMPAGDYRVIARASGFQSQIRDGVRVTPGQITNNVNFAMSTGTASAAADFAVAAVAPAFGTDGDTITVIGTGFGTVPGRVTISEKEARIVDWNSRNDDRIIIQLPTEVETGPVKVFIGGQASHETQAVIFIAKPILLEARPPSAKSGARVTLVGRNFSPIASFNKITLNGKSCQVFSLTSTRQLEIILPQGAETGLLQIRIESNEFQIDGISTARITIPPELIHMSPKRAIPGVTITLYGNNFGSDRSVVGVQLGEKKTLRGNEILSLSDHKLTFAAPSTDLVVADESVEVRVSVNDFPSNSITWTAYNPVMTTITDYGIYEANAVFKNNVLHLPSLKTTDRFALVTVISGKAEQDLGGTFNYSISSILGNNRTPVPTLPVAGVRATMPVGTGAEPRFRDVGPLLRSWQKAGRARPALRSAAGGSPRPAISDPAPASTTFWMVDFNAANPSDPASDVLATATLAATGVHCLVYLDTATDTLVVASDAERVAGWFDGIYETLATACWDGVSSPPEGNIDDQPRILLFLSPQLNRGSTSNLNILGYFNPRDKVPAQTHSAGTEILYLWDSKYLTAPDDFKGVLAHELQHMLYNNQKGNRGVDWLDEGLSVWAQQVVGYGFVQGIPTPVSYVADYLRQPNTVSLNHWPTDSGLKNYGMSYLFIEYLFERCGGYAAIRLLEKNNSDVGFTDVQTNVLPLANPVTPNLEVFFHDFCMAMYCDNLAIPETLPGLQLQAWRFPTVDLRTGYSGVIGLRHLTFDENPVITPNFDMLGFGADVLEYLGGNGGDLEVTIGNTPNAAGYKLWVLYYQGGS